MSNPKLWRKKPRTTKPNSRQKRNGLFLDANPLCQRCKMAKATEAHHLLNHGHLDRYEWENMAALCSPCHVEVHRTTTVTISIVFTAAE